MTEQYLEVAKLNSFVDRLSEIQWIVDTIRDEIAQGKGHQTRSLRVRICYHLYESIETSHELDKQSEQYYHHVDTYLALEELELSIVGVLYELEHETVKTKKAELFRDLSTKVRNAKKAMMHERDLKESGKRDNAE